MNDAEIRELIDDLTGFLGPLIPDTCKWVLWLKPEGHEFQFWAGTMTDEEFDEVIKLRMEKALGKESAEWLAWFKKGPPK